MAAAQNQDVAIKIIEFKRKYARQFRDINVAWIEKYFNLEPYDQIILNDPEGQIIAHGGYVLFALLGGTVVGTCALLKHTERKFELAKMGVLEQYQGQGIGRKLGEAAIEKVRSTGADTLVLATSQKLEAANRLYHALGFSVVDLAEVGPLPYKRESIAMKLRLTG